MFSAGEVGKERLMLQEKTWGRKSKEFKVHSLIDKVYKLLNLYIAWEKVKARKGAGGVDRVSLQVFQKNLDFNLREIRGDTPFNHCIFNKLRIIILTKCF